MNKLKLSVAIACAGLLSACGGGGGSDDKPQTVRINGLAEVSVAESSVSEFAAQNTIKSITAIDGDANLTLSFSGRSLIVEAAELTSPAIGTYDVYMSKGEDTVIQRYEVMGVNTSAALVESIGYAVRDNYQALLELRDDRKVYEYFIDLAYLQETITPAQRDSRIAEFDALNSSYYDTTWGDFNALIEVFDQYLEGEVGESTLAASANLAVESMATHGSYGLTKLREAEDISLTYMAALPNDDIAFVEAQGTFSRFFAPSMLTTDGSGATVYTSSYDILTPITGL